MRKKLRCFIAAATAVLQVFSATAYASAVSPLQEGTVASVSGNDEDTEYDVEQPDTQEGAEEDAISDAEDEAPDVVYEDTEEDAEDGETGDDAPAVIYEDDEEDGELTEDEDVIVKDGAEEEETEPVRADVTEMAEDAAHEIREMILASDDERIVWLGDLSVPEDTEFPARVTFDADVQAGMDVVVYHFDGEAWEMIEPEEVLDGQVTAWFTSLSPVAVVERGVEKFTISYAIAEGEETLGTLEAETETVYSLDEAAGAEAIPAEGYEFAYWDDEDGNIVCTEPMFVPDILADAVYYAHFERIYEEMTLTAIIGDQMITASGVMPWGAELSAEKVTYTESYEHLINGEDESEESEDGIFARVFTIYDAFDIEILVDGGAWQPVDDDTTVTIAITGVEIPETDGDTLDLVEVHRISDDETEAVNMGAAVSDDGVIEFETEHFTVFTIGGSNYDSGSATSSIDLSAAQDGSIVAYVFKTAKQIIITGSGDMKDYTASTLPFNDLYYTSMTYASQNPFTVNFIDADGITRIGAYVFWNSTVTNSNKYCYFNTSALPSGLQTIGARAFCGCTLLSLASLPDSVTEIGMYAFSNCESLNLVSLPSSLSTIGNYAFAECTGITHITVPDNVTSIGSGVFSNCTSLASIDLPAGISTIPSYIFNGCINLDFVSLPSTITTIESYAFQNCTKLSLTLLPDGLLSIGAYAFAECPNLSLAYLPENVILKKTQFSEGYQFRHCTSLALSYLPDSITEIGPYTFSGCIGITTIELPSTLAKISSNAFYLCDNLTEITGGDNITDVGDSAFMTSYSGEFVDTVLYTESSAMHAYDWDYSFRNVNDDAWDLSYYGDKSVVAYWYKSNGKLIVDGSGTMKEYGHGTNSPISANLSGETFSVEFINADSLTEIGQYLFENCANMTISSLPDSITTIKQGAFSGCSSLALSSLPSGVTSIGRFAFYKCTNLALTSLPDGITEISNYAFNDCGNLSLSSLPSGITRIGVDAFGGCNNITLTALPSGVTEVGDYAFYICRKLALTSLPDGLTTIGNGAFGVCPLMTITEIPSSVTSIGEGAFRMDGGITVSTVPSSIATIPARIFESCDGITEFTIPSTVTSIGSQAFDDCTSMTKISGGANVTSVGTNAFWINDSYKEDNGVVLTRLSGVSQALYDYDWEGSNRSVNTAEWDLSDARDGSILAYPYTGKLIITGTGPMKDYTVSDSPIVANLRTEAFEVVFEDADGITTIGDGMFTGCRQMTMTALPDNITSIGQYAFTGCSLLELSSLPSSLTEIKLGAFSSCTRLALTSLSDNLTTIWRMAFQNCSALALTSLPDLVTIPDYAFAGCEALALTALPDTLTSIGENAFSKCSSITISSIPEGVTTIGGSAFQECSAIESIMLPDSLTTIGQYAFFDCDAMTTISGGDNVATIIGDEAFYTNGLTRTILITESDVLKNYPWFDDNHRVIAVVWDLGETGSDIKAYWYERDADLIITGSGAMKNYSMPIYNLTNLSPVYDIHDKTFTVKFENADGITHIGDNLFAKCEGMTLEGNLPSGLTSIGDYAFQNCTGLDLAAFPANVTRIGMRAFDGCTALSLTELNDGITSIGEYAFYNCSGLALTKLPDSLTTMGSAAFNGCSNITVSVLPGGLTNIPSGAFFGCSKITVSEIPDGVTNIGSHAFAYCSSIPSMSIPASVTSMGDYFGGIFTNCTSLASVTFEPGMNLTGATSFNSMFANTALVTVDLSQISGTDGVTGATQMFLSCGKLETAVLSGLGNVANFSEMFYGCTKLRSVDVTNLDTGSATAMVRMFSTAYPNASLNTIQGIADLDVSNVANAKEMFENSTGLTGLDLSGWNLSGCTTANSVSEMLNGCTGLETIECPQAIGADIELPSTYAMKDASDRFVNTLYEKLLTGDKTLYKVVDAYTFTLPMSISASGEGGEFAFDTTSILRSGVLVRDKVVTIAESTTHPFKHSDGALAPLSFDGNATYSTTFEMDLNADGDDADVDITFNAAQAGVYTGQITVTVSSAP